MKDLRFGVAALLVLAAACGGKDQGTSAGPPPGAKRVDASTAGSLSGKVTLDGAAPANLPIKLSADPFCAAQNPNGATFENQETWFDLSVDPTLIADEMQAGVEIPDLEELFPDATTVATPIDRRLSMLGL